MLGSEPATHRSETGWTRRGFLGLVLAAAAALSGACRRGDHPERLDRLARHFEEHFSYLDLRRDDLIRFLQDYESAVHRVADSEGVPSGSLPFLKFIESTDFFLNGADESLPVRYFALRDPYLNPCFNPFLERDPAGVSLTDAG